MKSGLILWNLKMLIAVSEITGAVEDLPVVGINRMTTVDYPDHLAAVIYTQGCLWKCRYCHNSHLRETQDRPADKISWEEVISFLRKRKGFLEAVVFCGGEPTIHPELTLAMKEAKKENYLVGLHTSGMFPSMLRRALPFCDWVGMDVKAPWDQYEKITDTLHSGRNANESVSIILESRVPYEFRTTVHPDLLSEKDILEIAQNLKSAGADHYALQGFSSRGCRDEKLNRIPFVMEPVSKKTEECLRQLFRHFQIRLPV